MLWKGRDARRSSRGTRTLSSSLFPCSISAEASMEGCDRGGEATSSSLSVFSAVVFLNFHEIFECYGRVVMHACADTRNRQRWLQSLFLLVLDLQTGNLILKEQCEEAIIRVRGYP